MPEEIYQEREQTVIERILLVFHLICSIIMTWIAADGGWPLWMPLLADMGWLFCVMLHCAKISTYSFRAYAVVSLMQIGAVIWSVGTGSLTLTLPVLSVLAVALAIYGIPEIVHITIGVTAFVSIYHLFIKRTVDLSSRSNLLQTILEIVSIIFIEYIMYVLNRARLSGMEKQMQIVDSLREAERSKDDFMANVSHEIRTPINTICGMSEIVLREELTDQVRMDVFGIQTAGRSLQSIVSDVLDFTEMQSGKMTLMEETYNITSTINDVINMSMARKNEKQIDLIVDCDANLPSGLIGDEQKIRRIIMNLVNNALKFTAEGCVCIIIGARKTEYGINLVVRIKDTGIGMKKESLEKLFSSFNQVDTRRNRQEAGIGLGLAISQALVDMMGGFITVASEYGKGSEIQFVIPQKVADATPIAVVKDREAVNVAIYVDMESYDRPEVRDAYGQVIVHMISQLRVKCHVCQNLQELKRRAKREKFTHIFISIEEYEEDIDYFDEMSGNSRVITIIERLNDTRITNPRIHRLYKPFFILPVVMALNDENLIQGVDANYYYKGKFIAPEINALVVDDNLMNIRVLEGLLRPYQIKVAIATSGAEALDKIESMSYDVIFMDHMMPEMDGIETLHRIRQKQGNYFKKIPVIAVTANAVGGMQEVFLKEGFQDFIAKPIEVSVLERVLRRILPQEKIYPVKEESQAAAEERLADQGAGREAGDGAERNTDLPPDTFNEQRGVIYCGGLENYLEILRLISRKGQADYNEIGRAYEKRDWPNYTILVHALKSTMRSVGVEKLSDMAKELEMAGKRGNEEYISRNHDAMMLEYIRVLGLLKESSIVRQPKEQPVSKDGEELGEEELDRLSIAFEDAAFAFEHERMTEIAERLAKSSYQGHPLEKWMEPVMRKIEMSDYLSASEVIARLKEKIAES